MANEIALTLKLTCTKSSNSDRFELIKNFDQTTEGSDGGSLSIGTSEEDLTITDVTTPGVLILYNLDPTNYVQFGPKSGTMVAIGRLLPLGPPAMVPLDNSVTVTLKANSAACKVKWLVLSR